MTERNKLPGGYDLPFKAVRVGDNHIGDVYEIQDVDGAEVCSGMYKKEAAAIVNACNSHAQLVAALEAAEQCIGELSSTQARVEAMQMIQSALNQAKEKA